MAMNHPTPPAGAPTSPPAKRPLDTVVKMALGVLFGSFALIWGGMFLSRPDRSIPPYSIGSQEETIVAGIISPSSRMPRREAAMPRNTGSPSVPPLRITEKPGMFLR